MSGTSVDAIDAAIISIENNKIKLHATHEQPFSGEVQGKIQKIIKSQAASFQLICEVDSLLAFEFAQAVSILLNKSKIKNAHIKAIGSHGQTVFHEPNGNHTASIQLGSAHKIAAMTHINVVYNFRQMDMALGGQGAPLAPLLHSKLFYNNNKNTAVINLGGIANISFIGRDYDQVIGYDIGPANCLIDEWINIHKQLPYDENGSWARQGRLNSILLAQMLEDNYFAKAHPKSTGREHFNRQWYNNFTEEFKKTSAVDIQTTLTHLIAASIEREMTGKSIDNIVIMGGGSKNDFILELIHQYTGLETTISNDFGYDADWIEAILFAYLAHKRINKEKINLTSITGSSKKLLVGDLVAI